jgi:hypothetical protein
MQACLWRTLGTSELCGVMSCDVYDVGDVFVSASGLHNASRNCMVPTTVVLAKALPCSQLRSMTWTMCMSYLHSSSLHTAGHVLHVCATLNCRHGCVVEHM